MLFNSLGFLFAFLPLALILYYVLLVRLEWLRRPFLIVLTLIFYAVGAYRTIPLLLLSVAVNYLLARVIAKQRSHPRIAKLALATGICFDLGLLFYFKYMNFFVDNISGGSITFESIALPLGISFFTFQQVGFLVDLSRGRFAPGSPIDYAGFVLFFPQLLAGPIVRYDETVPQLRKPPELGAAARNILIGLSLVAMGLFKKAVLADSLAYYANPVFDGAATGGLPGLIDSWIAAFAYTAQIYFDFAGYSDMALGVARMFGVVLPLNFYSPLRSPNIVALWRRWHITLGRWVQSFVFQPLSLPLARFAANRVPGPAGDFIFSVAIPTMAAMIIVGIWHGAGWTFVVFGAVQGVYMIVNQLWSKWRRKRRKASDAVRPFYAEPLSRALTLVAFVVATVTFRAPDLATAGRMYLGMLGFGGGTLDRTMVAAQWPLGVAGAVGAVAIAYVIVLFVPNSVQIMTRFVPVLEWPKWLRMEAPPLAIEWRLSARWVALSAIVLFLGYLAMMRGTTKFIYFNF